MSDDRLFWCPEVEKFLPHAPYSVNVDISDILASAKERKEESEMTKKDPNLKVEHHKKLCDELNEIYKKKNHDYGDSFHHTFVEEGFAMSRIRLSDKLSRFKTLSRGKDQKVSDESIRDTLMDLANYAIMTILEMDETEM